MRWHLANRADQAAARLADRHYNRQSIGHRQIAPPGRCVVLVSDCARAFWITSWQRPEFVKHEWPGAWVCSAFRSEGAGHATLLISDAIAATCVLFGQPPAEGLITFIDRDRVQPIMVRGVPTWGWTWKKIGFREIGTTRKRRYLALGLAPDLMPPPAAPLPPRTSHAAAA